MQSAFENSHARQNDAWERLEQLTPKIIEHWDNVVRKELPAAQKQDPTVLHDGLPNFLINLARDLSPSRANTHPIGSLKLARHHGKERASVSEYSLNQVLLEYHLLRKSIIEILLSHGPLTDQERDIIHDSVDRGIAEAGEAFMEAKLGKERKEKQYMELLAKISSSMISESYVRREGLENLIKSIMDGLNGVTAAILLYTRTTNELVTSASVGMSSPLAESFREAMSYTSFSNRVLSSERTIFLADVEELEHDETGKSLKKEEIRSLLGLRMQPQKNILGMLFIGFKEPRHFESYEIELMEDMTKRVSLILENIRLYDQSQEDLENLRKQKELREQFVSTLTHDLRTPLTAAKLNANALVRNSEVLEVNKKRSMKILESIERIDRMIQDLLDTNRIRAGQKIALHIAPCDLRKIAQDVLDQAMTLYGDRIVLTSPETVQGYWDGDALRRAMENLIQNAVKYGSNDTPITLTLNQDQDEVHLSVHNYGNPIPKEHHSTLFEPFRRLQNHTKGWGVGLTLVRGVAEAHEGKIQVESDEFKGTTFSLTLPNVVRRN